MQIEIEKTHAVDYPTGTKFYGNHNDMGMQDYGLYTYPDGTKYLGQFYNNRFHGIGTIEMPWPHCVCFNVLHHHGKLKRINSMSFNDKLPMKFEWNEDTISFDNWDYCGEKNRSFNGEKLGPMEAVGPFKYQTQEGPNPPPLGCNIFDLGFGKFNRLGCITEMPSHLSETKEFYVGCSEVRSWIQDNCRHGELRELRVDQEMMAHFSRQILHNNLESEKELIEIPVQSLLHQSKNSSLSAKEVRLHLGSTSDSYTSRLEKRVSKEPPPQLCGKCNTRKRNLN